MNHLTAVRYEIFLVGASDSIPFCDGRWKVRRRDVEDIFGRERRGRRRGKERKLR